MNREDVIRMAREAGMRDYCDSWTVEDDPTRKQPKQIHTNDLASFAALVAAHVRETEFKPDWNKYQQGLADGAAAEREACAKVCDAKYEEYPDEENDLAFALSAKELAVAIRARGQS